MKEKNRTKDPEELSRMLDYHEGDIVQIKADGSEYSGKLGVIIGISKWDEWTPGLGGLLSYKIKISDTVGIAVTAHRIRLVRAAGSDEDLSEDESKFLPDGVEHKSTN